MPFRFTGNLAKLTLTIDRPKLTPEDEKRLMEAQRNNKTSEWRASVRQGPRAADRRPRQTSQRRGNERAGSRLWRHRVCRPACYLIREKGELPLDMRIAGMPHRAGLAATAFLFSASLLAPSGAQAGGAFVTEMATPDLGTASAGRATSCQQCGDGVRQPRRHDPARGGSQLLAGLQGGLRHRPVRPRQRHHCLRRQRRQCHRRLSRVPASTASTARRRTSRSASPSARTSAAASSTRRELVRHIITARRQTC